MALTHLLVLLLAVPVKLVVQHVFQRITAHLVMEGGVLETITASNVSPILILRVGQLSAYLVQMELIR